MKLTTAHLRRIIKEEVALVIHESEEDMAKAVADLLTTFPGQGERLLSLLSAKVMEKKTPAAHPGTKRVILSPEEISAIRAQAGLR